MKKVIFACVHNAGRSQMAAAFFNALAKEPIAISAGTKPAARVHAAVVLVMMEVCIDLSKNVPRLLDDDLAKDADALITMGCGDECPVVPGALREDWPLDDPKDQPIARVRIIRDDIRSRVDAWLKARTFARDKRS
jgi:arsenate reductase (thioredoxin)